MIIKSAGRGLIVSELREALSGLHDDDIVMAPDQWCSFSAEWIR